MSKQNTLTIVVVIASAIIPYLISQQDVVIAPVWKVVLTAANIGLVALSRFSNPNSEPQQVTVTGPVQVTPDAPAEEPKP